MFRWRSEVNAGFFFISLSPLYTEAGSLTYTKSPQVGLLQLASLLCIFYLCFPLTKITGRSSCPLDIYMGAGDLISGSYVGLASPLPSELSPFIYHLWETLCTVERIRSFPEDRLLRSALVSWWTVTLSWLLEWCGLQLQMCQGLNPSPASSLLGSHKSQPPHCVGMTVTHTSWVLMPSEWANAYKTFKRMPGPS